MHRALAPLFLLVACFAGAVGAEPDRTEALAKAKTKFEQDVSKAEDVLIASMEKAQTKAQAAGNKAAAEKLTYDRELFVSQRILPTTVPTAAYLKVRSQAVTALGAVYQPVIKELTKAKKTEEAEALENALSALLKSARGYGLAVPDLAARPLLVIENKALVGQVIETVNAEFGYGEAVLAAKAGKRKPLQCWRLEREEKGYTIQSAGAAVKAMCATTKVDAGKVVPGLMTYKLDTQKETPDRFLFQLTENRSEVLIVSSAKGESSGYVLATVEKKVKGVTVHELTLEKKETPPKPNQLWIITEAK